MTTQTKPKKPAVIKDANYYKKQTIARRKAEAIRDEMKLNKEFSHEH